MSGSRTYVPYGSANDAKGCAGCGAWPAPYLFQQYGKTIRYCNECKPDTARDKQ